MNSWFEVDRDGLRQLMEGRDKSFVIRELVQNAWDEPGVTCCNVTLEALKDGLARVVVEDDAPEGFSDLRHAYTLYAHTRKRSSAEKRGRFNLGEKEVLALCRSARIVTTKGTVEFLPDGKRRQTKACRDSGSVFDAVISMTHQEIDACSKAVRTFLPPAGVKTTFNGQEVCYREPLAEVEAKLVTEFEDKEGRFRGTVRKAAIMVYKPMAGERAMIYEMGLPITETGDKWHYDIQQRVPLNSGRDTVRAAYLQDVRAEVVNALAAQLTEEDAGSAWVRDAAGDERIKPETLSKVAELRWGEKRAVAFPGDSEARDKALAAGFHLVTPREMSAAEWEQMRKAGCVPSASVLFPQPKAAEKPIPEKQWTEAQRKVADLTKRIARLTLGLGVTVKMFASDGPTAADYARETKVLRFNAARLGKAWFSGPLEPVIQIVIHELGHEYGGHISEEYYEGLAKLGAKLALREPKEFLNGLVGGRKGRS